MNSKTLIASLALVAGIAGISPLVQAAQTSSEPTVQSPTSDRELKVNDRAPDIYQRSDKALKNWKQKGLKAPVDQAQWVQINDKYVMVMITNGTIVEMQPVERKALRQQLAMDGRLHSGTIRVKPERRFE